MDLNENAALIGFLRQFKLDNRLHAFDQVLAARTRYLTVVLENIDHSHNQSAVLRSCECFGIQDVYVIDDHKPLNLHKNVAMGSYKWLTLKRYNRMGLQNTPVAIADLKAKGYRIVATTPHEPSTPLEQFDIEGGPAALVFGAEQTGVSTYLKNHADAFLTIPTVGFTQSLNISVSAAIILQHLTGRLRQSNLLWSLNASEQQELMLEWLRKTIPKVELLEQRFHLNNNTSLE